MKALLTGLMVLTLFSTVACARGVSPVAVLPQNNPSASPPLNASSNVTLPGENVGPDIPSKTPETIIASGNFRADKYRFAVDLPPGWAAAVGPVPLSVKTLVGLVAFNSWNQSGFWAAAEHIGNSYSYSRDTVGRMVPDGGAYVVLLEINGPPFAQGYTPPEYASSNLDGLWTPHNARLDGGKFIGFYKWGQTYEIDVYLRPNE